MMRTYENGYKSGFALYKQRIDEVLESYGLTSDSVDDDLLLPYYRSGESENYVLTALGCNM